jgi:hypothetical protein
MSLVELDPNTGVFEDAADAVITENPHWTEVTIPRDVRSAIRRSRQRSNHSYSGVRLRVDGVEVQVTMMIGSDSEMIFSVTPRTEATRRIVQSISRT